MTFKFDGWPRKIIGHFFYTTSSFVHHLKPLVNSNWSYCPKMLKSGQNPWFFVPCDLEIWWMILKNNRAPFLCYFKLCTSFQSYQCLQTGVRVRKRSIRVKISNLLSRVTLKFDGWTWKTTGHLFYDASSFMHHFIAIGEFKLKLHSGYDLCDLDLWPMTLTFCMDITSVIGNSSWKFGDVMMTGT